MENYSREKAIRLARRTATKTFSKPHCRIQNTKRVFEACCTGLIKMALTSAANYAEIKSVKVAESRDKAKQQ